MAVFIQKGDAPLTDRQLHKRTQAIIDRDWPEWKRERSIRAEDGLFNTYMAQVQIDTDENRARNDFNRKLDAYRRATARLARYRLADGRPEITEEQETGEIDPETGEPITETVVVQSAIPPFEPQTIEQPIYDPETGEQTGNETVTHPQIAQDDAERAEAQAVVDATPQAVREWDEPESA